MRDLRRNRPQQTRAAAFRTAWQAPERAHREAADAAQTTHETRQEDLRKTEDLRRAGVRTGQTGKRIPHVPDAGTWARRQRVGDALHGAQRREAVESEPRWSEGVIDRGRPRSNTAAAG